MNAITEVCAYLKNWFDIDDDHRPLPSKRGDFTITGGSIDLSGLLIDGQYFRIQNSILNDGVYKYPAEEGELSDETFTGKVQSMKVPKDFLAVVAEISEWIEKYGAASNSANSPFNSESFAGYSYSKSSGGTKATDGSDGIPAWWSVFGGRLARWRKL